MNTVTDPRPVSFDTMATPFAVGIRAKADLLENGALTRSQSSAILSSVTQELRKLCDALVPDLLTPLVSVAAAARAADLRVDLRACGWQDQKRFDRNRSIFHLEHCETVKTVRTACLDATDHDAIVQILHARLSVAWILKTEDAALNRLGFKQDRADWRAAYVAAGIRLTDTD